MAFNNKNKPLKNIEGKKMQARRKSKSLISALRFSANEIGVRNTNLDLNDGLSNEQRARVECVLRIINNFIEKLQVFLVLPHIMAASRVLVEAEFKEAGVNLSKLPMESLISDENVFELQQFVEEHFRVTKLWSKWLIFLTNDNEVLLKGFTLLYKITRHRLSKSAFADLTKEKKLFKLQQNIVFLDRDINEFEKHLHKQKNSYLWKLGLRAALIHKNEEDLAYQKWDNNMRIKQEIVRSSKAILSLQNTSQFRLKKFEQEAEEKRLVYKKLLQENLLVEKEAQMEKKKLLFQLQTYIRKHDQNVGDKLKENLSLQENYMAKKAKFDEFMLQFRNEEKEYLIIVEQKEREEQLLFEQKLMVFMMGRAARAIQVRWRRFRRDQKKKGKKKGKGKKK